MEKRDATREKKNKSGSAGERGWWWWRAKPVFRVEREAPYVLVRCVVIDNSIAIIL